MASSNFQLLVLQNGGTDGGKRQVSGDGVVTDLEVHKLVITADTTFTTLTGVNAAGSDVDMRTVNGLLTAKNGAVIGAPDLHKGGYIKTVTISAGELHRYKLPTTERS
jgi:hypothetical protein